MSRSSADVLVDRLLASAADDDFEALLELDESELADALEAAAQRGDCCLPRWWEVVVEFGEFAGRVPRGQSGPLDLARWAGVSGSDSQTLGGVVACLPLFEKDARLYWADRLSAHPDDAIALNAISSLVEDQAAGADALRRLASARSVWIVLSLELRLRLGDHSVIAELLRRLDESQFTAWGAFEAIEACARREDAELLRRVYERRFFVSSLAPRAAAAAVVLGRADALEWLRRHADSGKPRVRSVGLGELLRVGEDRDRARVAALVEADDPAAGWVVSQLGRCDDTALVELLDRWLARATSKAVRLAAAESAYTRICLGRLPLPSLGAARDDVDEEVRRAASRAWRAAAMRGLA